MTLSSISPEAVAALRTVMAHRDNMVCRCRPGEHPCAWCVARATLAGMPASGNEAG